MSLNPMTDTDPKRRWIDRLSRGVERLIETPQNVLFGGRPLSESEASRLLAYGVTGLATILKRPSAPDTEHDPTPGRFVVRIETGDRPAYECTILQTVTHAEWERLRLGATVDCRIDADRPNLALLIVPRPRTRDVGDDLPRRTDSATSRPATSPASPTPRPPTTRPPVSLDFPTPLPITSLDSPTSRPPTSLDFPTPRADSVTPRPTTSLDSSTSRPPTSLDSESLLSDGNRATATVIEAEPLKIKTIGTTDPMYLLTLELRCDSEPEPWQVSFGQQVPRAAIEHVSPGRELQVAYVRSGQDDGVTVDWPATLGDPVREADQDLAEDTSIADER
jgi:hypothetical protein